MKFTLAVCSFAAILATVSARIAHNPRNTICRPLYSPYNYTGVQVDRQTFILYRIKSVYHNTRITTCKNGEIVDEHVVKAESVLDNVYPWKQQICNEGSCIRIARKQALSLREVDIYFPFTLVGGVFQLVEGDGSKDEHYKPMAALMAGAPTEQWFEDFYDANRTRLGEILHTPLLMSENLYRQADYWEMEMDHAWFKDVSATESYDFTNEVRNEFRQVVDSVMSLLKLVFQISTNSRVQKLLAVAKTTPSLKTHGKNDDQNRLMDAQISYIRALKPNLEALVNDKKIDFGTILALIQVAPKTAVLKFLEKVDLLYNSVKFEGLVTNFGEKYHT